MITWGIILAGGRSTRMGRDKARLPFGAETLLSRQHRLLTRVVGERVVVSGAYPEFLSVADRDRNLGPLGGLRACLPAVLDRAPATDAVLVVPVDMPLLTEDSLRALLHSEQARSRSGGGDVIRFRGSELPAVFRDVPRLLADVERLCSGPDRERSFRRLCGGRELVELGPERPEWLMNTNTREDYHEALSQADDSAAGRS